MKKQMLMYGLLEWVKKEVPDRVALYLVTARTDFCQHLEKRVKSRLTANFVFWQPPTAKGVLEAVRLRVLLGGRCWRVGKGLMGVLGD
jgi:Cdc6-like AAA superfamily ATPase